jgi:hypothetical protein
MCQYRCYTRRYWLSKSRVDCYFTLSIIWSMITTNFLNNNYQSQQQTTKWTHEKQLSTESVSIKAIYMVILAAESIGWLPLFKSKTMRCIDDNNFLTQQPTKKRTTKWYFSSNDKSVLTAAWLIVNKQKN